MDKVYLGIATAFFFAGFAFSVAGLRSGRFMPSRFNLAMMAGGFVFQSLFLAERGRVHHACPVTSWAEMLVFIAWAMVIIYLVLGPTYEEHEQFTLELTNPFDGTTIDVLGTIINDETLFADLRSFAGDT